MLKFLLYLDKASDKKYTAAKQQNKAEVQNMSKIPTLNTDRAELSHPEKSTYTAAAAAVYPAGRPQQHRRHDKGRSKFLFFYEV